jgi:hypothetical protein
MGVEDAGAVAMKNCQALLKVNAGPSSVKAAAGPERGNETSALGAFPGVVWILPEHFVALKWMAARAGDISPASHPGGHKCSSEPVFWADRPPPGTRRPYEGAARNTLP